MLSAPRPERKRLKSGVLKSEWLTPTVVQPLVEARTGEVQVTFKNPLKKSLRGIVMKLQEEGGNAPVAARRFAVVPSFEDGGYQIDEIEPETTVTRTFCLRPVEANVGTETQFEATVESGEERIGKPIPVRVEARPEVYAAVGAAEWLRERLLAVYDELQRIGLETHKGLGETWPGAAPADPARVALSGESFKRVFEAIQLGVRIVDSISRKSGGAGGGSS